MKKKYKKQLSERTVWVGECACGTLVYELEGGTRFTMGTRREHTYAECQQLRQQHGEKASA